MKESLPERNTPSHEGKTVERIVREINVIREEINLMGGNDFEIPVIDALLKSVRGERIIPEEALKIVQGILDHKKGGQYYG